MDRDNKFSGTLPLLAYAPRDFGLNAQRSRAYRARAAMGRTGVQPLRSHAQAPAMTVKAAPVEQSDPEPSSSLFKKLWQRVSGRLKSAKSAENTVEQPAVPVSVQQKVTTRSLPVRDVVAEVPPVVSREVQAEVTAHTVSVSEDVVVAEARQAVSKTYAAMRKSHLNTAADDQSIPQAPDLSHALAEIRQALREHEKLANARQSGNSPL
ncbi:hypothetical protein [Pseudochrobactrum kiredjianiae]|uniref:Uncharacterized protein n=1 Tax=Pseudochrobactrum kiredjianiae TaxID=386305 RepID=A0ABW3V6J7_9HYPH|nr:hypothetical protein [Pseudochrobactrum kiredjianiae]MDM7850246.1 hypothetical protein [Pseudochrobactrum kiredjianiae]